MAKSSDQLTLFCTARSTATREAEARDMEHARELAGEGWQLYSLRRP